MSMTMRDGYVCMLMLYMQERMGISSTKESKNVSIGRRNWLKHLERRPGGNAGTAHPLQQSPRGGGTQATASGEPQRLHCPNQKRTQEKKKKKKSFPRNQDSEEEQDDDLTNNATSDAMQWRWRWSWRCGWGCNAWRSYS